jgi:hypothetical protein
VSVRGLSFDGTCYHLITESDPGGLGNVFLRSFDTLADLALLNQSSVQLMGTKPFGSGVSIGGVTFDGTRYHLITESDPGGLGNVFLRSFDSLADLAQLTQSSVQLMGTNPFGSGVSIGGLMAIPDFDTTPTDLPVPGTLALLVLGLAGLGAAKRLSGAWVCSRSRDCCARSGA